MLCGHTLGTSTKPKSRFGLFGVSMLIGIGCGFVPFDIHAGAEGHIWNSDGYTNSTLVATAFGGLTGISFGWLLNAMVRDAQDRRKLVRLLWTSYCCGLFLYLLLRPAIYAGR
jgi:hypothetical protein